MLVVLVALLAAQPAAAAPTPIAAVDWQVRPSPRLLTDLSNDCFLTLSHGWHVDEQADLWSSGQATASGVWDPPKRGVVVEPASGVEFDSYTQVAEHNGHAWAIRNVALQLIGGRAYISAVIGTAQSQTAAVRRERIAVIAHPKFLSGSGHKFDRKGHDLGPIPNTFVMELSGTAKITPAFVAATSRWRCTGHVANFRPNSVRRGETLGKVDVVLLTNSATGLAGTIDIASDLMTDTGDFVSLTPTAPATAATVNNAPAASFAFPTGSHVALQCELSVNCTPTSGSVSLAGGFVLTIGGHSSTVGNLAISWSPAPTIASETITGTLDGQPITVANGAYPTDQFLAALSNSLGVGVTGFFDGVHDPQFTSTGPP